MGPINDTIKEENECLIEINKQLRDALSKEYATRVKMLEPQPGQVVVVTTSDVVSNMTHMHGYDAASYLTKSLAEAFPDNTVVVLSSDVTSIETETLDEVINTLQEERDKR